ncbi:hypothetical protein MNEG_3180 [Monoraphidium neglectum]|uniref:SGNH hydrolase-type esterase domain-containing protein n=1 Tax=Monoraphidium neglectum TaxID=145388 RepID=A0A0D2LDI9_9CHLO|nr:hypothetical protein MNEG_3180 [Monoraphidium neglectum]KIZ04774.1 hypothetical protein MNEG_3180 [Monoraphidium neglectum]|eukprot:XP_013903793.1 hypothetical protein MNEG_3180 [Monoraphidium neglectum]
MLIGAAILALLPDQHRLLVRYPVTLKLNHLGSSGLPSTAASQCSKLLSCLSDGGWLAGEWYSFSPECTALMRPAGPIRSHTLLLGDSVDRYLVDDFCSGLNSSTSNSSLAKLYDWTDGVFFYKTGASAAAVCDVIQANASVGSLAFVHLYGSQPHGPYLHGHVNNAQDPYTDTALRIPKALEQYQRRFQRLPDLIVYQAALWDVVKLEMPANLNLTAPLLETYVSDVRQTVANLTERYPGATLMLRTTPGLVGAAYLSQGRALHMYNAALRHVARERGLVLLDWAAMNSGIADFLRDRMHPDAKHSRFFANVIVSVADHCTQ